MNGNLEGLKVIAFTHFAVGPTTVQLLGDYGAEVIKIEAPWMDLNRYSFTEGEKYEGISPYFLALNRNQRDIVLDLKKPEGNFIAKELLKWADVVVENHRPGTLDKLELGYEGAKKVNPEIIYASCSAYGQHGPWRDKPGQDLLLQASSGLASLSGRYDDPPIPVGAYVADAYTAALLVGGILAALNFRNKTGKGQWVQIDMLSSVLHMVTQEATYIMNIDTEPKRSKSNIAHIHQHAPYGVYKTRDGYIAMSLAKPEIVKVIADELGVLDEVLPYLSKDGLREHRDFIASSFAKALVGLSTEEALIQLSNLGIWCEKVRSLPEVLELPVVLNSDRIINMSADYGGDYQTIGNPLEFSEAPVSFRRPAPAFGEHSEEILMELGFSSSEISSFINNKAVFISETREKDK